MSSLPIPLAFWAKDRAEAERQALEWAANEPAILEVHVVSATQLRPTSERWTVELDVTLREKPQQEGFGL